MDTRIVLMTWMSVLLLDYEVTGVADSLYNPGDPIVHLDVDNFADTLSHKPHGWVVEYYATWCGHCQRFAPIYRQYATDIAGWSKVIQVGAIACSDPRNMPVCRDQHIRGFPTVKFYPANMATVGSRSGTKLNGLRFSLDSVRAASVRYIEGYLSKSPGVLPNLERYQNMQYLLVEAKNSGTIHLYGIVEENDMVENKLAKTVILDMSSDYPRVMIGRLPKSAILDQELLWQPLPSVVAVDINNENEGRVRFVTQLNTREDVHRVIRTLSAGQWHPHVEPEETTATPRPAVTTDLMRPTVKDNPPQGIPPQGIPPQGIPLAIPLVTTPQAPIQDEHQPDSPLTYRTATPLTQSDMDSNIYYMLWNEVSSRHKLKGEALPAFKDYLDLLTKYHPSDGRLRSFLETVSGWIQRIGGSLGGSLLLNTVEGLQNNESYVVQDLSWESCAGSEARYRGYPCSLWMTFHALTVGAYEKHLENPAAHFDPMDVLGVIRNYVHHFLGCRECAHHFQRMARHMERDVTGPDDVILWLWQGHNRVNNRLSGDDTEDPNTPKIQFPSPEACPRCRRGVGPHDPLDRHVDWDTAEVLAYLTEFYSKDKILGHMSHTTVLAQLIPTPASNRGLVGTFLKVGDSGGPGSASDDDNSSPTKQEETAESDRPRGTGSGHGLGSGPGSGRGDRAGHGIEQQGDSGSTDESSRGSGTGSGHSSGTGSGHGSSRRTETARAGTGLVDRTGSSRGSSGGDSGILLDGTNTNHDDARRTTNRYLGTAHSHTEPVHDDNNPGLSPSGSDQQVPSYIPREPGSNQPQVHGGYAHTTDSETNPRSNEKVNSRARTVPPSRPTVAPSRGNSSCVSEPTPWSTCSVTCGVGISTRLSNLNTNCEMRMEMRACQIRPCSFNIANYRIQSRPGQCTPNMRSASHLNLTFNGCTTIQGYRWRFCNRCHGYCCEPANDGTFWADVRCQNGDDWQMGVMQVGWIISCTCRRGSC